MKFPIMNKRPRQAVVVPELNGGLNLRDSVSMVNDNQLIDCKNVWFRDGVLRTRAGISGTQLFHKEGQGGDFIAHDIYTVIQGENCRLFSQVDQYQKIIHFHWIGKTILKSLPSMSDFEESYFLVQKGETVYFFCAKGIYKCDAEKGKWLNIEEKDIHIPTVAINGIVTDESFFSGVMWENPNLLASSYKVIYSTVNPNHKPLTVTTDGVEEELDELHGMSYNNLSFCEEYSKYAGKTIKAVHTDTTGEKHYHSITLGNDGNGYESEMGTDDLIMNGNINGITFWTDKDFMYPAKVFKDTTYIKNNLEIEFPVILEEKEKNKVLKMTRSAWFGGDSAGINGGTRLFLGGNTDEPNLVIWSDLNNPLYFPENNYFYVGESSSAVTAFGKQSDMLVIFKEDETYFTQYNRNSGITANDLIDQTVIDYITSSVYFPLTLINANIGCDCPDSVQLCRNRLIWASSEGKIYTLVSNNQYSERNIFEISEMVQKRLKMQSNLKKAHSSDWNGYYLLQVGSDVYVLDYNSYGYQYVSSYSKTEDANIRIPWYYWEFELTHGASTPSIIATIDNNLKIINSGAYGIFVGEISENSNYDNMLLSANTTANYGGIEKPIECYISTKLFEFGAAGYRKNVDKVMLSLGNNGGEPIKVEYITDEGTEEEYITLDREETESYSPSYVKSVPLNPCIRSVERFGVKLSCEGPLAVDGITLFYRILGGVK